MQKISTCLWFDDQAEEAANFYVSVFRNAKILAKAHYVEGLHKPVGSVMTVRFMLDGHEFVALNGGPQYRFSPAMSIIAHCDTQEEVDHLWEKLTEGGTEVQCGWLTDRFGVSWQIVPKALIEMFGGTNAEASQRATAAMLKMKKLDIAALKKAYDNA